MKIKKRLQVNVALAVVMVLIASLVLFLSLYQINKAANLAKMAAEILAVSFESVTLRTDYLRTGNERSQKQVIARHNQISELLQTASEKFTKPQDKETVDALIKNHESTGKIFRAIIDNRQKRKAGILTEVLARETEDRLVSQLNMKIYDTVIYNRKLMQSGREARTSAVNRAGAGILILILLVCAAIFITSWSMGRAITDRVQKLHKGAYVIGDGNLNHRIDMKGNDEFAELSAAFDAMTTKLQASYHDLSNEIAERRKAEAELKISRRFLEISNKHADLNAMLREFVAEAQRIAGCEAIGIRLRDENGNIPYQAYVGFSRLFYEAENPLSIRTDQCMCVNVISGKTDPALPFYTEGGSFYTNGMNRFLATASEADKGRTRNMCSQTGYESIALIPIKVGAQILGLLHLADHQENKIPPDTIKVLEQAAAALGAGIQRALAEAELDRQREWLRVTLSSIGDAVIATDAEGAVTFMNAIAEELTGWPLKEAWARPVTEVFHIVNETTRQTVDSPAARVLKDGMIVGLANHTILLKKDGTEVPIDDSGAPIRDAGGKILGVVLVFRDITGRRKTEKQLQARSALLAEANRELESFSYSVSHDLQAPLRAIDGYSRMILREWGDKFDESAGRKFNLIRDNIKLMGVLITSLLSFSRLQKADMNRSEIDMDKLASELWKEIRMANKDRDLELINTGLLPAFGDRSLIRQVLFNLLDNAVKYTKNRKPGVIEMSSRKESGHTVYCMKDNGAGFDMDYYNKLFGVFQRLHSPGEYEGTGVGLAIVQRIITRHGGRIWAEGEVDKGASFYFTLPGKEQVNHDEARYDKQV